MALSYGTIELEFLPKGWRLPLWKWAKYPAALATFLSYGVLRVQTGWPLLVPTLEQPLWEGFWAKIDRFPPISTHAPMTERRCPASPPSRPLDWDVLLTGRQLPSPWMETPSSLLQYWPTREKNSILILFQWIMKQFILYYLDNKPPHEQDSNVSCLRGKKDLLVGKYWERKADKDQFQLQLLPGAGEQASVVFWGPGKAKNCECLSLLVGVKVKTATNNFLFLFA